MGIFYNPPPPPTGSNAATPPEPHVPIAPQGQQPPRYSTALMLVAVLASWPQPLEPRLAKPNDQQQKVAPLTLPYGQQPPNVGTLAQTEYAVLVGQWPLDLEPRLGPPNNRQQTIAPLTLAYGSSPPIVGEAAVVESTIVGSWPLDLEPRLGPPNNQQQHIAPLTLAYGTQPPTIATSVPARYQLLVGAWPADLEPRLSLPNNTRVSVAPLSLAYGSQPTPTPALNVPEFQAIVSWPQPEWPAQSAPKSTAWIAPPPSVSAVPFPYGLVLSTWPADLEPRLSRPNDQIQKIAPLTLPTGASPQPQPPLSVPDLIAIVSAWPTTWDAQTAPKNAAWNVPPVLVQVPSAPLPRVIWSAWDPAWVPPPTPVAIAPLTLPTGQTAPAGPSAALRSIYAWPVDAPLVPRGPSIAALIPPTVTQVPYTAPPALLWTAWSEPFVRPPTAAAIAPLTLIYGAPPPPRPSLATASLTAIVATWVQAWDAQTAPKNAAWHVPPSFLVPPSVRLPRAIRDAWEPVWSQPPRSVAMVPFTLTLTIGRLMTVRASRDTTIAVRASRDTTVSVAASSHATMSLSAGDASFVRYAGAFNPGAFNPGAFEAGPTVRTIAVSGNRATTFILSGRVSNDTMAKIQNVECYKGEDILINDQMDPVVDVTGWTIVFTLKASQTAGAALITQPAVIDSGPAGTFHVSLSQAQTLLPAGTYYYDIQRTDAGQHAVLTIGVFTILQEVLN